MVAYKYKILMKTIDLSFVIDYMEMDLKFFNDIENIITENNFF